MYFSTKKVIRNLFPLYHWSHWYWPEFSRNRIIFPIYYIFLNKLLENLSSIFTWKNIWWKFWRPSLIKKRLIFTIRDLNCTNSRLIMRLRALKTRIWLILTSSFSKRKIREFSTILLMFTRAKFIGIILKVPLFSSPPKLKLKSKIDRTILEKIVNFSKNIKDLWLETR